MLRAAIWCSDSAELVKVIYLVHRTLDILTHRINQCDLDNMRFHVHIFMTSIYRSTTVTCGAIQKRIQICIFWVCNCTICDCVQIFFKQIYCTCFSPLLDTALRPRPILEGRHACERPPGPSFSCNSECSQRDRLV